MKPSKILFVISLMFLVIPCIASAGDFDWMRDLNINAEGDPLGFRARLEARFQVGALIINTVLDNVEEPADAYMLLRLGEMSNQPMDHVIEEYKTGKDKGWGAIAKSLGIKPGSKDFFALKQGQDLYNDRSIANGGKHKGKGKGRK